MKKIISTDQAPKAIGPYSQAVRAGDFIYISGQLPIDPKTGEFAGTDIKSQTRQSLANLKAILQSENADMDKLIKVNVFLDSMDDFAAMNEIYAEFFTADYPARAAVEVAKLPKSALVEIEGVAYCG